MSTVADRRRCQAAAGDRRHRRAAAVDGRRPGEGGGRRNDARMGGVSKIAILGKRKF